VIERAAALPLANVLAVVGMVAAATAQIMTTATERGPVTEVARLPRRRCSEAYRQLAHSTGCKCRRLAERALYAEGLRLCVRQLQIGA